MCSWLTCCWGLYRHAFITGAFCCKWRWYLCGCWLVEWDFGRFTICSWVERLDYNGQKNKWSHIVIVYMALKRGRLQVVFFQRLSLFLTTHTNRMIEHPKRMVRGCLRVSESFCGCWSNQEKCTGVCLRACAWRRDATSWTYWVRVADGHLLWEAHFRRVCSQAGLFGCTYEGRFRWLRMRREWERNSA